MWIGAIGDVSQRAVEPNFPTRTIYWILGLLAMGITRRPAGGGARSGLSDHIP